MRNDSICIVDSDTLYVKAFIRAVTLGHTGFSLQARSFCGSDCAGDADICIKFGSDTSEGNGCGKSFEPKCGKYAGVARILSEARAHLQNRAADAYPATSIVFSLPYATSFAANTLICVYAFAGGIGTSCAAIGIGRELARYRGEQVLYLSLEYAEDPGLFPTGISAMRADEIIYRYLRIAGVGEVVGQDAYERLFAAAVARDEYGLYRLAPDEGIAGLAQLAPDELYLFLSRFAVALDLSRIVLDFGVRLGGLVAFADRLDTDEAVFVEVLSEDQPRSRKRRTLFTETESVLATFPYCEEDIRLDGGKTEVGLANAFGLAVKGLCDCIRGDSI